MDLTTYTDEALAALQAAVAAELERRSVLASAVARMEAINQAYYLAARGDGKPFTPPKGMIDTYPKGAIVVGSDGKKYASLRPNNSTPPPGPSWKVLE